MKLPHSSPLLVASFFLAVIHPASAVTTLLDDTFGDGTLATNPDTGGGFTFLDNGANAGTGSISESGSLAGITEGTGSNTSGIHSSNAFDLSDPGLSYTTTWEVANLDFGTSGSLERIFLSLQTNDSWLFGGDTEESRILVEINAGNNDAYLRYQNRSGSSNNNFTTSTVSLGSFSGDANGFTATLTLDSTGYSFTTVGLDATNQVNIAGTWATLEDDDSPGNFTDFATVLGTDGPMHVAAYIQDAGSAGSSLDVDRISLTSVPEPGAALLAGLGSLMLLRRRR